MIRQPISISIISNGCPVLERMGSEDTLIRVDHPIKTILKTPDQKRRERTKKAVQFFPSVLLRKIQSWRQYSDKERDACWISENESSAIRKSAVRTVKKMTNGINVDKDPNDCSRGLEFKTPQTNKIRSKRKANIMRVVQLEQELQIAEGVWDDDALAYSYSGCSAKCKKEARKRGKKDEIVARRLTVEPPIVM